MHCVDMAIFVHVRLLSVITVNKALSVEFLLIDP